MERHFRSIKIYFKKVKKSFGFKRDFLHEDEIYLELSLEKTKICFIKEDFVKKHMIRNGFYINNIKRVVTAFELEFITNDLEKIFRKALKEAAYIISKTTNDSKGYKVA